MDGDDTKSLIRDPWSDLRRHTPARIALGRAGPALPTQAVLEFGLAHARARDAVHQALDLEALEASLRADGYAPLRARSAAPDRVAYLTRPDLGRRLDEASAQALRTAAAPCEIAVVLADGLSAIAVQQHALPLLAALRAQAPQRWSAIPAVLAVQSRVALGDAIGAALRAHLVVVMIGERPGLSSPDSLGLYVTHAPRIGMSDAERNCISNVRPQGLGYAEAARKLDWLAGAALARGLTGVGLKDESDALPFSRVNGLRATENATSQQHNSNEAAPD
ncbi:MAG: ethanolamine ammonia-lyase [Betaproteobacteria bacterium]|nr:ethanolamine ammonia-lyase [Betaproteobacteria bacterium]